MSGEQLAIAITAYVGFMLSNFAVNTWRRGGTLELAHGITWRDAGWGFACLVMVVALTAFLLWLHPLMGWNWWRYVVPEASGGTNVNMGQSQQTGQRFWPTFTALLYPALLALIMPVVVGLEEKFFRKGSERRSWPMRVLMALAFGAAHMVVGVPVAVAVALALFGWVLTGRYLRAWKASGDPDTALRASIRVHLLYNWIALGLLILTLAITLNRNWSSGVPQAAIGLVIASLLVGAGLVVLLRRHDARKALRNPAPESPA